MIKPIQTKYNGYLFRSKLEAHWAKFLDELGVNYLYEPQGYDLDGSNYLPDLLIPEGMEFIDKNLVFDKLWVEVKPPTDLSYVEKKKIVQFVTQTENDLLVISGYPGIKSAKVRLLTIEDQQVVTRKVKFFLDEQKQLGLVSEDYYQESRKKEKLTRLIKAPQLLQAYQTAKQFRFDGTANRPRGGSSRTCRDCGEEFTPRKTNHALCWDCYQIRLDSPRDKILEPKLLHNQKREKRNGLWRAVGFVSVLLMFMTFGVFLFIGNRSLIDSTEIKPTPTPACRCDRNLYDCKDFENQETAQECFDYCYEDHGDVHYLDMDEDDKVCEGIDG